MFKRGIIVLGGGLVEDGGVWRTTDFNEADDFGILGDRLRVEAAYCLYQEDPAALIIATGGKGRFQDNPEAPAVSAVIKKELIALGAPAEKIKEESKSGSTFEQLAAIAAICQKENWQEIKLISNEYHLPRIKAMMETSPALAVLKNIKTELISAEEILLNCKRGQWEKEIAAAYAGAAMKTRLAAEDQGRIAWLAGNYKTK